MQIAKVCSRWWVFKNAERCGCEHFVSFGTETGLYNCKDTVFPAAVLDERNLKMLPVKWHCWGKVCPELQPRCISPGVNLCPFPVYGKRWDQGWTAVFTLIKSFWSSFLRRGFQASKPLKAFRGMLILSVYTPLHSVISIPDRARCFSYFLCLYT